MPSSPLRRKDAASKRRRRAGPAWAWVHSAAGRYYNLPSATLDAIERYYNPDQDPNPDPAILHVYGRVRFDDLPPEFTEQIVDWRDTALFAWLGFTPPDGFAYFWYSDAPEHAGLVLLAIFPPDALYADPYALLALTVRETALFTPELRSQIHLLLP